MQEIVRRVRGIVLAPQAEWPAVAREAGSGRCLFYVAILALIPPLARFVGGTQIGGFVPFVQGMTGAVLSYALTFAIVYAVALLADMLAPAFGGERDFPQSLRLTVYSFTPVWLAGIFLLVPGASFLTLLGLYGFHLLWTGAPVVKRVERGRALPYALAVTGWALALEIVVTMTTVASFGTPR